MGAFDYNRTPMAPAPGTKVLIHEKPLVRETWSPHVAAGFYLGPALDHYRCYRVYVTETKAERIADTLAWFPAHVQMPTPSSDELVLAALKDVVALLKNPAPASSLSPAGESQLAHLHLWQELFAALLAANINDEQLLALRQQLPKLQPPPPNRKSLPIATTSKSPCIGTTPASKPKIPRMC